MTHPSGPDPLWQLPTPLSEPGPTASTLAPELLAVLQRRGWQGEALAELLRPSPPPAAQEHFPDLTEAVGRLSRACDRAEPLAVCGDYDADGMTSTALLVGVLERLGARPRAAIPSRQEDGYGLNVAMVERLQADGVRLLVTVDNGVAALEALQRARQLGVEVIVTDHHTLPPERPPLLALLHPALTPPGSPYRGLAGVGLAHVLASALAAQRRRPEVLEAALDLFCLGTIADMAPLTGVNRHWLQQGLPRLHRSRLPGLQALCAVAGVDDRPIDSQGVGFRLAPRLNAVGRLDDPALAVELLTTADAARASELAGRCEDLNRQRRELCDGIEAEAQALLEADGPRRPSFLLLAQTHWHHGVIGIVAARLVEHWGLPVALLAGQGDGCLRASVRAPQGFAVDGALQACADLLERHGGHPAAGGFTVRADHVGALHERLCDLADRWLAGRAPSPLVAPEALLPLERIDRAFHRQLQELEPFGIGHPRPLFWSPACRVLQRRIMAGSHLSLEIETPSGPLRAIAWRWNRPAPQAPLLDLAFHLVLDSWQGRERLQLELVALRPAAEGRVLLQRGRRLYDCRREGQTVTIRNPEGQELRHVCDGSSPLPGHPATAALVHQAAHALGLLA
ncbi:MAG: single-stranded-DNA-specific exonuclease RecJ [Prochlorococcaceae cyanobacterium]